jgi:hypothetical protein
LRFRGGEGLSTLKFVLVLPMALAVRAARPGSAIFKCNLTSNRAPKDSAPRLRERRNLPHETVWNSVNAQVPEESKGPISSSSDDHSIRDDGSFRSFG